MAARPDDADESSEDRGAPQGPRDEDATWLDIVARLQDVADAAGKDEPGARGDASTGDARGGQPPRRRSGDLPADDAAGPDDPAGSADRGGDDSGRQRATGAAPDEGTGETADALPGHRGWTPAEPDPADDHFHPPDPGPVLGGDPLLTLAWTAVGVGLVLLLLAAVFWTALPAVALQAAGAVFLTGVGILLWRMPDRPDDGDDANGPGAVV